MNYYIRRIKQPFIWLRRFRKRCGYGVHSPFAFDLITTVVYEESSYYAYKQLEELEEKEKPSSGYSSLSIKKNRLLFRLVNKYQPSQILDVGAPSLSALYLQASKPSASYVNITRLDTLSSVVGSFGFIYIHQCDDAEFVKEAWNTCMDNNLVSSHTVLVLEGIHYNSVMKAHWQQYIADERVGITFDLYDVGILFFDKSKIKQHYIVNF